jgi:hypothetical protein
LELHTRNENIMKKTTTVAVSLLLGSPLALGCAVHAGAAIDAPPPPQVVVEGQVGVQAQAGVQETLVVEGEAPAPPPPQVEVTPPSPGVEFVWIGGFHRWDGHHYVWIPGRYEHRPHANAHWRTAHWEPRGHGHVWVEGGWDGEVVAQPVIPTPPPVAAPVVQTEVVVEGEAPAPPPPQVEVVPAAPGPDFFWVRGYHRWDGHHYVWMGGRYERRPHPNAQWRAAHWETRGRGHVWIEGNWDAQAKEGPAPAPAPAPAAVHPWYLHALSDLRNARANLERKGGDKQMKWDEHDAIGAIDRAIHDIKEAALDDGKNLEDHPAIDAHEAREGRLHKALSALRTARGDIEKEEDHAVANGLRARALRDIDEAIRFTDAGVQAAARAS